MGHSIKKRLKNSLKSLMNQLPYVRTLHKLNSNSKFPAGHYCSSVVSLQEMRIRQNEIWPNQSIKEIPGVDLAENEQIKLFQQLLKYFENLNLPEKKVEGRRYFYRNSYFSYGDAHILGAILLHFRPKRIIEVGSGFSSALMMDINEFFLNDKMQLTFIDPFPETRLDSILQQRRSNRISTLKKKVQEVDLEELTDLDKGDILFIDSTHVVKTGSDVNYILFEILPRLRKGVMIHFHDIFHPFEYPKSWVLNGFGWNESYFMRSFLSYNSSFKILLFSDFLVKHHTDEIKNLPLFLKSPGSSLWLEKT